MLHTADVVHRPSTLGLDFTPSGSNPAGDRDREPGELARGWRKPPSSAFSASAGAISSSASHSSPSSSPEAEGRVVQRCVCGAVRAPVFCIRVCKARVRLHVCSWLVRLSRE